MGFTITNRLKRRASARVCRVDRLHLPTRIWQCIRGHPGCKPAEAKGCLPYGLLRLSNIGFNAATHVGLDYASQTYGLRNRQAAVCPAHFVVDIYHFFYVLMYGAAADALNKFTRRIEFCFFIVVCNPFIAHG